MDLSNKGYINTIGWNPTVDPLTGEVILAPGGVSASNVITEVDFNAASQDVSVLNPDGKNLAIYYVENSGSVEGTRIKVYQTSDGVTKGPLIFDNKAFVTFTPNIGNTWEINIGRDAPDIPGVAANLLLPTWMILELEDIDGSVPDATLQLVLS